MSNDFKKNIEESWDEELNVLSLILAKQINEIQLEIALDCIEQQGMMPEFNQFLINNKYLNLWESLEQFSELHAKVLDKDHQSSREKYSLD